LKLLYVFLFYHIFAAHSMIFCEYFLKGFFFRRKPVFPFANQPMLIFSFTPGNMLFSQETIDLPNSYWYTNQTSVF